MFGIGTRARSMGAGSSCSSQPRGQSTNEEASTEIDNPCTGFLKELIVYSTDPTVLSFCREEGEKTGIKTLGAHSMGSYQNIIRQLSTSRTKKTMVIIYVGDVLDEETKETRQAVEITKVSRFSYHPIIPLLMK